MCENVAEERIADFIQTYKAEEFGQKLEEFEVASSLPYLNSGFFVLRSDSFLRRWSDLAGELHDETLFEQNAFNLLAHGRAIELTLLDNTVWNALHHYLEEIKFTEFARQLKGFFLGKIQVAVAHATSSRVGDIEGRNFSLQVDRYRYDGYLKMLINPDLRQYQQSTIQEFMMANFTGLQECRLLSLSEKDTNG